MCGSFVNIAKQTTKRMRQMAGVDIARHLHMHI